MNKKHFISIALAGTFLLGICSCFRSVGEPNPSESVESKETETNPPIEQEETADLTVETDAPEVPETDEFETDAPETDPPAVLVDSVRLSFHTITLGTGSTVTLTASIGPADAENRKILWVSSDPSVATVDENGKITAIAKGECVVTAVSEGNSAAVDSVTVTVENAPTCTYIDGILIANKTYALPDTYGSGVDGEAYDSLLTMMSHAAGEGISLWLVSGYRSYWDQYTIYNNYVARDGQAEADRYSARPGHSEHQSGMAFDLNSLYQSFGDTAEGIWLAENCHRFGFVIRYPQNKEHITGYMYEPWHVRYVGVENAVKIKESGLCIEEYFGITSVYGG